MTGLARHRPVELILLRQFAARLTTSAALFDTDGGPIDLNSAAEAAFGVDFAPIGELPLQDALIAQPTDVHGILLGPNTVPVGKTLGAGRPELGTISIQDFGGRSHRLGTTTIPVRGLGGVLYGAMSLFWDLTETN
jgi:hypothetical protein